MAETALCGQSYKVTLANPQFDAAGEARPKTIAITGSPEGPASWTEEDNFHPARLQLFGGFIDVCATPCLGGIKVYPANAIGKFHQERFFSMPSGLPTTTDQRDYMVWFR